MASGGKSLVPAYQPLPDLCFYAYIKIIMSINAYITHKENQMRNVFNIHTIKYPNQTLLHPSKHPQALPQAP